MRVQFFDASRANRPWHANFLKTTDAVLSKGWFIAGSRLDEFEKQFAVYCGVAHCAGVGNGLDAIALALRALGVGPGDEVIVPAFTFIATWFAVSQIGAIPVAVDVLANGNINPALVPAVITQKTRAIVPVHLYGQMADMTRLLMIAETHGLKVVEDAAQAHGSDLQGRRAGTFGHATAFSFYPTKNLGALGDGGAVVTNDPDIAASIRKLRNYGSSVKYEHDSFGVNSRLDELQAAYLGIKLPHLDESNRLRRRVAKRYLEALQIAPAGILTLPTCTHEESVWHLFVVRSTAREEFRAELARNGVETVTHYPTPPYEQPPYWPLFIGRQYPVAAALRVRLESHEERANRRVSSSTEAA